MPPIHFQVRVREALRHAPDVASYVFDYAGRRPRFRPGQFLHLALDEYDPSCHWPESRVFSIASAPSDGFLRLTISRQGRFTSRLLDTLAVGREVWCKGPYGEFEVRAAADDAGLVLIAGGTGITPFCAFMADALGRPPSGAASGYVSLYYGARTPDLLVYRDLAARWAATVAGARAYYTAESGGAPGVAPGRLDVDAIATAQAEPRRCRFYLSGPKAMIVAFRDRLLQSHGLAADRVVIDAWD